MRTFLLLILLLSSTALNVFAEDAKPLRGETSNTLRLSGNENSLGDIDNEITNSLLRAQLGAKSRWSFKSFFGYSGGSIEKPLSELRPNYRAGAKIEDYASLMGTVGVNYRLTERDYLDFSTGITIIDPLHNGLTISLTDRRSGGQNASIPRFQVAVPSVGWSRGYSFHNVQMISGVSYSHFTDSDSANQNAIGAISFNQTLLETFLQSRWSGGLAGTYSYNFFGGSIKSSSLLPMYEAGIYRRTEVVLGIYPFLEYAFTDRICFRTVMGYFEFWKYKDEYNSNGRYFQAEPYQSVGLGISVTRDIYLYPNVQFTPKDIRADRTNVALSTNINI